TRRMSPLQTAYSTAAPAGPDIDAEVPPVISAPVVGFHVVTEPSPLTWPNQPDLSSPAPSAKIQFELLGVPSGQPLGVFGSLGVSPLHVMTTLSPIFMPAHIGSGSFMRSFMKPSQILPSVWAVIVRLFMSPNAPCGSSLMTGKSTALVRLSLNALTVVMSTCAIAISFDGVLLETP